MAGTKQAPLSGGHGVGRYWRLDVRAYQYITTMRHCSIDVLCREQPANITTSDITPDSNYLPTPTSPTSLAILQRNHAYDYRDRPASEKSRQSGKPDKHVVPAYYSYLRLCAASTMVHRPSDYRVRYTKLIISNLFIKQTSSHLKNYYWTGPSRHTVLHISDLKRRCTYLHLSTVTSTHSEGMCKYYRYVFSCGHVYLVFSDHFCTVGAPIRRQCGVREVWQTFEVESDCRACGGKEEIVLGDGGKVDAYV
ncbi:hypothetical protein BZA77DRAFT_345252 [Pyronema omphalodes]|nr:hypothetical protein BZA77DRAFT_345252 [Pyronema omphalodes]